MANNLKVHLSFYFTGDPIMFAKTNSTSSKIAFFALALMMVLIPSYSAFAQGAGGIPIEKDVLLEFPIQGAEDLPDAVTFSLYDSEDAVTPLAAQAFPRGEYTLDFDFNKSDGLSSGTIARFKVNFTNKLNLNNAADTAEQPKEIWAEFSVGDSVMGSRSRVPDDAMVQLLLASDASIATYLTLAYEGDDNPIATIYRDLPLDSSSSGADLSAYFSTLPATDSTRAADNWNDSGSNVWTSGNVGIGTQNPAAALHVQGGSIVSLMTTGGALLVGEGLGVDEYGGYVWDAANNTLAFATAGANIIAFGHYNGTVERMRIDAAGNVGIRTAAPGYTLAVNGSIGCHQLTVTTSGWADFVFKDGYSLPPLEEIETFITKNKHLPGIPSETEVKENGVDIGKISAKLLQKIEELTLYVIDLKKDNNLLKKQLTNIKKQIDGSDLSHR
jgi:hypothetical protein